eukprot:CAMPEP_0177584560 /NCGR_PEP_ID=MMETSP0419_2-20121207/3968_1 /TAXON_ID=582737 /ORGANISM="Tetraselmis sp., Strain GSL018" /LENGTH=298 /DNA_ID=CAMNT_0019074121 /DNA_START=387 /DNA_END=1283 /DNA_ORIENTATION=+
MDLRLRMTVVRLQDRSLWVHSPLALTEECRRGLSMVAGEVSHVVIPSLAPQHWIYASAYRHYFPKAQLWVPPGLMEMGDALSALEAVGITELVRLRDAGPQVLGQSVPRAWAADIDMAMFACPVYAEAAFHLLEHRLLLTSDLCLGASSSGAGEEAAPLQAAVVDGLLPPDEGGVCPGPIFQANKEEAIRWVAAVAEMDFDVIAPAHMEAPIYNGKRQFIDCFRYVFSWDLGAGDEALEAEGGPLGPRPGAPKKGGLHPHFSRGAPQMLEPLHPELLHDPRVGLIHRRRRPQALPLRL